TMRGRLRGEGASTFVTVSRKERVVLVRAWRSARIQPAIVHRGARAADRARGGSHARSHTCASCRRRRSLRLSQVSQLRTAMPSQERPPVACATNPRQSLPHFNRGADYHRHKDTRGEPDLFDGPDPSDVVAAVAKAARGQPDFLLIVKSDQTAHQRFDLLGGLVVPYREGELLVRQSRHRDHHHLTLPSLADRALAGERPHPSRALTGRVTPVPCEP